MLRQARGQQFQLMLAGFGLLIMPCQRNEQGPLRTDNPALLRQAPTTWNISPTYDIGRLSLRVGLAYNGANIFQYFYQDLAAAPNPTLSSGRTMKLPDREGLDDGVLLERASRIPQACPEREGIDEVRLFWESRGQIRAA